MCFILLIGSTSCSKETKYNTLSVFFDGVPKPDDDNKKTDSTLVTSNKVFAEKKKAESLIIHPPYEDRKCNNCHDIGKGNKTLQEQPDICYNCHESFVTKYAVLHGPAESGYCSECHNPHTSEYKHLLLSDKQKLCFKCHAKKDVLKNDVHSSIDETLCWDCHNPHGGADRTFMK